MPIFPRLELEEKVQVNDKTRLDATKSFKTDEVSAVSQVRIKPEASGIFITVAVSAPTDSKKWYLDWQYSSAGTKTVTLEFTDSDSPTPNVVTSTMDLEVVTAASENLFSKDADLISEESDILRYVRAGRASFIDVHRTAQENILNEIYKNRILSSTGTKLLAADVIDVSEVKQWSKYMVLKMIFEGISNAVDDVFARKAEKYLKKENEWRELSFNFLKLDYDKSGALDSGESLDFRSSILIKR